MVTKRIIQMETGPACASMGSLDFFLLAFSFFCSCICPSVIFLPPAYPPGSDE